MAGRFPLKLLISVADKATGPLGAFQRGLTKMARGTIAAGKAMTAAVTAPILAMGGVSVAAFAKFEQGMSNVSTLVNTSAEDMRAMGAEVLAISRRTPVAIEDLTSALYDVRSAGVSAADQFKVLEGSARLAVAGLGTTKEAVDLVTSAVNAWGLQGDDAARVYDQVFKTVKAGKTTVAGLAQGFGSVASIVASAGIKLDDYLASVAALTTTGLPAAEAHTQLRAAIVGLTREKTITKAVWAKLQVKSFKELISASGGLVPALQKVSDALGGNETKMIKLFGRVEAVGATLGLTGAQAEAFRSTLAGMRSGVGAVDEAFAKQDATTKATLQKLRNNLEAAAISIGRILVPVLEQLVPQLERAAAWWESLDKNSQVTIVGIAGAAAALGPTLVVLGNLAIVVKAVTAAMVFAAGWGKYLWLMRTSIMAGLVPSLSAATASVWAFTTALLANPITWVVVALVALGAAAYQVYKNWEPLKEFFSTLWDEPREGIGLFMAWLDSLVGDFNNFMRGIFGGLWDYVEPIIKAVWAFSSSPFRSGGGSAVLQEARAVAGESWVRPTLGAERAAPTPPGVAGEARIQVDFLNVPRGVRVDQDRGGSANLGLDVGYAMGGF